MTQILGGIGISDPGGSTSGLISGSLTAPRVPYASGANSLTDTAGFDFTVGTGQLRVPSSIQVPLIIGSTTTTGDLQLRATSGVGTTAARVFLEVGNNGAIQALEAAPDTGGNFGVVGIGTPGVMSLSQPLTVFGTGSDIGYLCVMRAANGAPNAYIQMQSGGSDANAQAGFSFNQRQNAVEWQMAVVGNDGDAMRWTVITGGGAVTTRVAYVTKTFNVILDNVRSDPGTGSKCLILGAGTVPSSLAANTAGLYANADTDGVVNLFAINEAGLSVQLTGPSYIVTTTGNIDNLDFRGAAVLIMNNASDATIRGLLAGYDGQQVTIISKGAGNVFLAHQDTNSSAANRMINNVTSGVTPLAATYGSARYVYDINTARWRLAQHNQGQFIAETFNAGNFTASGSMTWTVASGDVGVGSYYIIGRTMFYLFRFSTTTVGGTPSTTLIKALPDGYVLQLAFDSICYAEDNGTKTTGWMFSTSGAIGFARLAGGNWSASTDNTKIAGSLTIGIN
jgi:hypothetical protein